MLTFSAVFGVIVYRITTAAALSFSTNETTRSNVRVTVTATAVILNLVVVLILDEIYGAVAKWLTEIGKTTLPYSSLIHVLTRGCARRVQEEYFLLDRASENTQACECSSLQLRATESQWVVSEILMALTKLH